MLGTEEDKAQSSQSTPPGGRPPLMAWPPLPTSEASGSSVCVRAFLSLQPFFWKSFNQASYKHHGRSSHLRAFIIETVFRLCPWGGGLSNNNNTNKPSVLWNTLVNLNFRPVLVTSQLIYSCAPPKFWEYVFLNLLTSCPLPEARASLSGMPRRQASGSRVVRRALGPITGA